MRTVFQARFVASLMTCVGLMLSNGPSHAQHTTISASIEPSDDIAAQDVTNFRCHIKPVQPGHGARAPGQPAYETDMTLPYCQRDATGSGTIPNTSGQAAALPFAGPDVTYHGGPTVQSATGYFIAVNNPGAGLSHWGNPSGFLIDLFAAGSDFIHITDQYVNATGNGRYADSNQLVNVSRSGTSTMQVADIQAAVIVGVRALFPSGGGGGYSRIYNLFLPQGQDTCFDASTCYSPDVPATFKFCAYHSSMDTTDANGSPIHVVYTVEPYDNVPGCQESGPYPNSQLIDVVNSVFSHETFELITDPDGNAWFNSNGDEIGDLCNFQAATFAINGATYRVQTEYDDITHACASMSGAVTPSLVVVPSSSIISSGNQGGPFSPASFTYGVSTSAGAAGFSISGMPTWLTASTTSGTATTTPINVAFTVNASANSLPPGTYTGTVMFTNTTNGQGNANRFASLTIAGPALQVTPATGIASSGTQGGPFSPTSFSYSVSTPFASVGFSISGVPSWLIASTTSGTATTSPTTVTFSVSSSAIGLPPGTYAATIGFANTTNGQGNQTRSATLTVNASGSPPPQTSRTWVSGVGSDSNPCSRTQPCLTFAGAYAKTSAGGEIDVLDPGDFGTLTITNAVTIDGRGVVAAISYAGSAGITIGAGAGDDVILRNLTLNGGGSGVAGIAFNSGASLRMRNVMIMNSAPSGSGLIFSPNAASRMIVQDASFINNGGGIYVVPASGGSATVSLVRARMNGNGAFGLRADSTTAGAGAVNAEVSMSQAANNAADGIVAVGRSASVIVVIKRSALVHNGTNGLEANGPASFVLADDSTIEGNSAAAAPTGGGGTYTYQTNVTNGNMTDNGTFSAALPLR
jgi:hypothetical protein